MAVRSRQVTLGLTILLGVLGLLITLWFNQQPSIKPSDVQIQAILRPPGQAKNPVPRGHEKWTMEITLDKTTQLPLNMSGEKWFFQVTPFVEGMSTSEWDFMQGLTNGTTGSPKGGSGYFFGLHGLHISLVTEALASVGMAVIPSQTEGFGYGGEGFPTSVRYYFRGKEPASIERKAWVVYSHYEKRWGRDVSWAKAFPAHLSQ